MGATSYDGLAEALAAPPSMTDEWMLAALWGHIERVSPTVVGFTVPFPGNVYGALRMAQAVKGKYPEIPAIQIDTQTTTDTISREGIRYVNVTKFLGELV